MLNRTAKFFNATQGVSFGTQQIQHGLPTIGIPVAIRPEFAAMRVDFRR
jgi:hypothetical protein